MQPNRRLVENVDHSHQTAANLPGQFDPLALATRERRRSPVQRQVIQPTPQQKTEPTADLFQDLRRDQLPRVGQLQCSKELPRIKSAQLANLRQRQHRSRHRDRHIHRTAGTRLWLWLWRHRFRSEFLDLRGDLVTCRLHVQPAATARGTARFTHVLFELHTAHRVSRLAVLVE